MKVGGTLSALELAKASFRFVWTHRGDYLRAAVIPCMAVALCGVIDREVGGFAVRLVLDLVSSVFAAILAVKWHRYYLLGPKVAKPSVVPTFGAREIRFCLSLVVGYWGGFLVFWDLLWPLGMIFQWNVLFFPFVAILLVPLVLFVYGRLSLALPAAAVGVGGGVAEHVAGSWRCMSDSTWSVIGGEILVGIPPALLFFPIGLIGGRVRGAIGTIMDFVVSTAGSLAVSGLLITVLSIAFDDLTPWREGRLVKRKK